MYLVLIIKIAIVAFATWLSYIVIQIKEGNEIENEANKTFTRLKQITNDNK